MPENKETLYEVLVLSQLVNVDSVAMLSLNCSENGSGKIEI